MTTSHDTPADTRTVAVPRRGQAATVALRVAIEAGILAVLFALYNLGRLAISGHEAGARDHAGAVRRLQEWLRLPSEAALQDALSAVPHLFEAANTYYVTVHFPVMIAFLVWGFLVRPRAEYLWARRLLVTMTFLALAIHVSYPLAPPRMFPDWGFVDTMTVWGPSAYDGASASVANQFAAMPSLHIGWALLIAWVLTRTASRPVAAVGIAHAVVTVLVVVVTANHWWLDGIVAAGLLAVALILFPAAGRTRTASVLTTMPVLGRRRSTS